MTSTDTAKRTGGLLRHVGLRTATLLVVANMIGAGIFTTTGFQAADLGSPKLIFLLWLVGGVLAWCGALAYAELGAALPRAGGEYAYLTETYGGAIGFMSAFVSLVAGFSAPIASASKGFVRYLTHFFPGLADDPTVLGIIGSNDLIAIILVWLLIATQLAGAVRGARFLDWITIVKVGGVVVIILAAAILARGQLANLVTPSATPRPPASLFPALGTSLIFVMFCYSGWNASAYIASELKDPQRDLPRSLLAGTAIVALLYLGLNAVYFYGAGVDELAGQVEVGLVAARNLFGGAGVSFVTFVLCASLVASAAAMTLAGPRVYYALGRDYKVFGFLATTHAGSGVPVPALLLQGLVTSVIILSGRIDQIMIYAGFTLTLFASLAVSCVITLRIRQPELPRPFRCWGYPVTPLLFLAMSLWMMFWSVRGRPGESILAFLTVAAGGLVFALTRPKLARSNEDG